MFYIRDGHVVDSDCDFEVLKRIARETICLALCFGHEYKKVGNQHTKYLKCVKCGKVV